MPSDRRGRRYLLTPMGEELRQPILALARWGMQLLDEDRAKAEGSRAPWGFLAVQAMMDGSRVPGVTEDYEFRVDDESFHIHLDQGVVTASRGASDSPALTITTDAVTFIRIGAQLVTPLDAVLSGLIKAEGDLEAMSRCTALLGLR
jgi:alkyl sulfatase BDS1-like metallo-beta-lactamase superfamily hydrolase